MELDIGPQDLRRPDSEFAALLDDEEDGEECTEDPNHLGS